jgi:hypothetical protein
MQCYHCNKAITKSWLHLQNIPVEEEDGITSKVDKHICGYSCYKRLIESNSLPNNLWSHIVNKSDYDGLIRPVIKQTKKNFEYLTLSEIQNMKDHDKAKYYEEKDKQIEINQELVMFREELEEEEYRTSCIEGSSESDYNEDDDY